jgi:hypothetical protein
MTCQCYEVYFLPYREIDNRPHYRSEQYVHVRSYALLSQAPLKFFKVIPSIFIDSLDYFRIQRGNRPSHIYCRGDRLDHLEQDHLRFVISAGKILNVWKDCFRTFGSIQGYQDPSKHG